MRILGLSFDFHDSSVALVENGKLVFACAEERLTRQKHDANFPFFAIHSALESRHLTINDIDQVVFYENPEQKFSRLLKTGLTRWPSAPKEFTAIMSSWLGTKLWTKARIAQRLKITPAKIKSLPHHLSHAYQAFVGSGFEEASVLVMDAVGEWDSSSSYRAQWKDGKPRFELLSEIKFPHSLGLFYSTMTEYLGFKPMNDECTTMALAAFGKPVYYDFFCDLLQLSAEGEFILSQDFFNFDRFYQKPYTSKLIQHLGPPRSPTAALSFSSLKALKDTASEPSTEELRFANIAASVQKLTEEIIVRQARHLMQKTGFKKLCFAGGVALNCVANTRLWDETGCTDLYIPPEPGDGGASIGAAFAGYFESQSATPTACSYEITLGPRYEERNFTEILRELNPNSLQKFKQLKSSKSEDLEWSWNCYDSNENLTAAVAALIAEGHIVGWFQDAVELGPRALGQRSILIRPDDIELAQKLSQKVKLRAPFRPYALSMTKTSAQKILEVKKEALWKQTPLQWMQLAINVRREFHDQVQAGLHIDGSTRPQVISDENNIYFQLIQKVGTFTGLECVLNTSFNEKDYPIVASPIEALMMFARTNMDCLVINHIVIRKAPKA